MLSIYKVHGHSMSPQFNNGDYLLLRRAKKPKPNDLVVYRHPQYGDIFKRVWQLQEKGFLLCSDNPQGISSGQIGLCQTNRIKGKLLWHFKQGIKPL